MARVELRGDLNAVVARMARAKVNALAAEVERLAVAQAPDAKIWISRDDDRVRPSHEDAHEQTIPANLRFKLKRKGGGFDLGRVPRDPELPTDQTVNCRCVFVPLPGLVARKIHRTTALVAGARVSARVEVAFPRIVESEHGTDKDEAARFLGSAVDAVAARLKAAARRT